MKSQTSLAARNCRLQEWSQMVHSCNNRPIGMSVNEWCRENFHYHSQLLLSHDSGNERPVWDSLSDEAVNQEVVPVPMNLVVRQKNPGSIKKLLPESVKGLLEFDFHGATRVTDQTSDAILAKVLGVRPC